MDCAPEEGRIEHWELTVEPGFRRMEAQGQTPQQRVQATGCPGLWRRGDAVQPGETPRSAANPDPRLGSEIRGWRLRRGRGVWRTAFTFSNRATRGANSDRFRSRAAPAPSACPGGRLGHHRRGQRPLGAGADGSDISPGRLAGTEPIAACAAGVDNKLSVLFECRSAGAFLALIGRQTMRKIIIAVAIALVTAYAGISASVARGDMSGMGGGMGGMRGMGDQMGNMMGGRSE